MSNGSTPRHAQTAGDLGFASVRNKAFPVIRDNQNLWRTINSYHEVVRSDNQLFSDVYFHITLIFKGIYKSSDCQG